MDKLSPPNLSHQDVPSRDPSPQDVPLQSAPSSAVAQGDTVPSNPVPSTAAPSDTTLSDPVPSTAAPSDTTLSDPVPSNPVPSNPVPSNPVPSNPVPSSTVAAGQVITKVDGALGWIVFTQPRRFNAMSLEMWQQVPLAIAALDADPQVRVIGLRGAGQDAFVAGADISQFETKRSSVEAMQTYNEAVQAAYQSIITAMKPTVAMIYGYCIGGGLALALSTDLRLAAMGARFGIPAAKLGIGYDYEGVGRLVDLVGPAFAKEIFYTGRRFSAEEALAMGLINRLYPAEALAAAVEALANGMAANAPLTLRAVKLSVECHLEQRRAASEAVQEAIAACLRSEDYQEGRRAFMEKRLPRFQGR